MISRRELMGAGVSALLAASARAARAEPASSATAAPVLFVSHGTPLFMPGNETRIDELRAWGATIPRPRGIVLMTPHFAARALELGRTGPGFAMYNLPGIFKRQLPPDLEYATPPSEALAERVEGLLGRTVARPERRGFDHTTWMPLKSLFPRADVPVLELGYPFPSPREGFELGRKLAPLRDEGILFVASGGMTHNLAAAPLPGEPSSKEAPSFVTEFDAWAADRVARRAVDDLVDFRHKAPAVELAHPDDGAHYRVLLVALGVALHARSAAEAIRFPITGVEAAQSKRCVELS
jgi:4,5-DOPA dioxygenase extradiol